MFTQLQRFSYPYKTSVAFNTCLAFRLHKMSKKCCYFSVFWKVYIDFCGSLLYGTCAMFVLNLLASKNKKYTAYDCFHGNGWYGEIPTKKEPIRTLGHTSRLPCQIIKTFTT